ncbi:MAG: SDR family oxidoreductase [Erysipelothrix sp.]|nr:SDR family oxidoreductase [Erysipelothrix sp.]
MNILVTGSRGFIGSNLVTTLEANNYNVLKFESDGSFDLLADYVKQADFVVHLAGVNRAQSAFEFYNGNAGLTETLVEMLVTFNRVPLLISSSSQAGNDTDYGKSKAMAEEITRKYEKHHIFRLNNVYGKWSRPNYNSVIATWCHNVARDIEIIINDESTEISFVYIDDVVKDIMNAIEGKLNYGDHIVEPVDTVSLGEVKDLIESFKESRINFEVPRMDSRFAKNLYSTYLSYIPIDEMKYDLKMNVDNRGSFTEVLKTKDQGQVSINVAKPGITKGQHWHHSKNEKFLVVYGEGNIEIRHIITNEKYKYEVSGDKLEVVDIPTGYTHNITNTGTTDMVTLMWANEVFDKDNPDTYFEEV